MQTFPVFPGLTFTVVKAPEFNTLDQVAPNFYDVRIAQSINPFWRWQFIFDVLRDSVTVGFNNVTEIRILLGFFNAMRGRQQAFLYLDPTDNSVGPALLTTAWPASTYVQAGTGILDSANHWQQVTIPGITSATVPTFNHAGGTTTDNHATWLDMGLYSSAGFPNILASLPIVDDGVGNYYSPLQRTLSGLDWEDITDLEGALGTVYANAVAQTNPTNYTGPFGPGLGLPQYSYMGLYIKWATGAAAWVATTSYALNALILDPSGHIQKATTAGTSGTTIPIFNDSGSTTEDPSFVVWTDEGNAAWAATHAYALGAVIIDGAGHAQVVTIAGTSGGTIPTFNDTGGTTPDGVGSLVWTDKGNAVWAAATAYTLGSFVIASGHAQKATAGGISGATTPAFSIAGGTVNDPTGSVVWTDQGYNPGPTGPITASFNFYFRVRFDGDTQDFEQFMQTLWTIGGSESQNGSGTLKLCTARPTPL